jgi:hypothetical protein
MTPSRPRYVDATPIHVGDRVSYNNQLGAVVFIVDTDEYSMAFPKQLWSGVESGFMIRFDNGALLNLDDADNHLTKVEK